MSISRFVVLAVINFLIEFAFWRYRHTMTAKVLAGLMCAAQVAAWAILIFAGIHSNQIPELALGAACFAVQLRVVFDSRFESKDNQP